MALYLILVLLGGLVGALAGLFDPLAPVAAVCALWLAVLGVSRPFVMLLLFLVVLYTRPADFVPQLEALQPAKVAALCALGVMVVAKLLERRITWARTSPNGWMMWLTAAIIISAQLGTDPAESTQLITDGWFKILIAYFLIVNLVDTPRRALTMQLVLAGCTTFLGGYALYAKIAGLATIEGSRAAAVGLVGDPNDLALTLLSTLPFLMVATLEAEGRVKVLLGTMLAITLGGLLATQSRGGLLGFGVAGYILLRERVQSRAVVLGVVGGGLAALLVVAGISKRETVDPMSGASIDMSAQGRLNAWEAGLRMLWRHPLFGVGFEEFPENYLTYAPPSDEYWITEKATHNSYIQAAAETGLAGFIPFAAILFVTVMSARRLRAQGRDQPPGLDRALRTSQVANVAGVLTAAFFLSQAWLWFIYVLVAHNAAMRVVYDLDAETEPAPEPTRSRALVRTA